MLFSALSTRWLHIWYSSLRYSSGHACNPFLHSGLGPQTSVAHWTGVNHILAGVDAEWNQTDATACTNGRGQLYVEEHQGQESKNINDSQFPLPVCQVHY